MTMLRVAAIQPAVEPDREAALARAGALIAEAAGAGARLVVLPERFAHWAPDHTTPTMAEPVPGRGRAPLGAGTPAWLAEQARAHDIYLVGGSLLERVPGSARPANTSLLHGPDGALLGRYRKIHLFDALVDGVQHGESATVAPGAEPCHVATPIGTIGLSICYDLRFPELYRALATAGMAIAVIPAGFTRVTGQAHWEILVRARAIENQAFVIAADMCGYAGPARDFFGHSMIVGPWGELLARLDAEEGVAVADLDLDHLAAVRARLSALQHRRLVPSTPPATAPA